jgi:hypothetical protein
VEPIRPAAVVAAAVAVPGAVVSVTPARVADSRVNQQIIGAVPASGTATVQVTGHGGLPAVGVAAVVLNVTVVAPQAPGYVTVWPTGIAQTNTSNLNFGAGQNIPNTVIVPVGVDGKVSLFNGSAGSAHLLVDVTGYTVAGVPSAAGAVVSVTPARVADSRVNQQIIGAVPASGTATVQVTGHGGLPAVGVAAVVLNVTVVAPQAPGYVTVWPTGIAQTNTSNLNFGAGQNIPNTVIVPVGVDGKVSLFNGSAGSAHLLVDVTGYTLAGPPPAVTAITPTSGSTSGGTVVTVTGTLLTGATTATFGGTAGTALTVLSDTQLKITSPGHPAGPVDLQVTTPGGTSAATAADNYTYVPAGVQLSPTVTIADGRSASSNSGMYLNNVNASGFVFSDGTVRFGTNYARVATIRGVKPTVVGTKIAAFESSSQDPPAILFSDLDGSNQQRFTKPPDGVIIAATPNGWLESVVAADGIP